MKAATNCNYSSSLHSFATSSKNKWNALKNSQETSARENKAFGSNCELEIGVSPIPIENARDTDNSELQKYQQKSKLRSVSCPEAQNNAKSSAESAAKANENLVIYRLYESARQKKNSNSKNLNKNSSNRDENLKRTRKLALVRHVPNHITQMRWSHASVDCLSTNKLNKQGNFHDYDVETASQCHCSSTVDCDDVKQLNSDDFSNLLTFLAEPEVKDAQCSVPSDLAKVELRNAVTEEEFVQQARETMFDATLAQIPDVTSASATTSGQVPERQSKMINIDGTCYILTMEPPGRGSFRSNSVASIEVYRGQNNFHRREANLSPLNGAFVNSDMVLQGKVNKEVENWYQQRDSKSTEVDLTQVGLNEIAEPYKIEALDQAALRLRKLSHSLKKGLDISKGTLCQNLDYAIAVLESNYLKGNRVEPIPPSDEEVLNNLSRETPVPEEIKSWLVETFSNKRLGGDKSRSKKDHRSLRSVVRTVQAGMMFDRISKKPVVDIAQDSLNYNDVAQNLKHIDKWSFDVFELDQKSNGNALLWVCYQLLTKHDLLKRLKISTRALFEFCKRLQKGYRMHNNRYHNPVHAADVAQTLSCLLTASGFINWFSDLEIFSMIMAALVHDVEHTGTTNNFHISTRSNLATLYNDRSVLEQHHVSTAFRIMKEDSSCDILENFSRDDYQDCRSLMIDMVLATDMTRHFEQVKSMETALQRPELLEKSKAMCLLLHSCDINHPAKPWRLHYRWTKQLVLEFFDQGDRERNLDLPISPLCDRHSAKVAQSQIGFIDFVVQPTYTTLLHLFDEVNGVADKAANHDKANPDANGDTSAENGDILKYRFGDVDLNPSSQEEHDQALNTFENLRNTLFACVDYNRAQWVRKDKVETEKKLFGENAFREDFTPDPIPSTLSSILENGSECQNEQTIKDTSLINLTTNNNCKPQPLTLST